MSINFNLLKPSASMEVTKLAGELKKQGKKIFPLGAGDTHFAPPAAIMQKMANLPAGFSHYTNAEGIESLRSQIAQKHGGCEAKDVLLVPGLKQGLYYALAAIQGKKLCILEPAWLGYEAAAVLADYDTISINTYTKGWELQLAKQPFDAIIICSPNNPDGKIWSEQILLYILQAAKLYNAWIITDFIYDRYIFEGSLAVNKVVCEYEKLIIGNGFSKSHAMTGFRAGYMICKAVALVNSMIVMQQNLATCVAGISQYLLIDEVNADDEIKQNAAYYQKNRDLVLEIFPEWEPYKPQGGFYYFIDLGIYGISDGQLFCADLLQKTGVALVPGSAYGKGFNSYVRLSFSIDTETLIEGLRIMRIFIDEKN
jgi:aspartate/methionine/tyrosine aminotransferase